MRVGVALVVVSAALAASANTRADDGGVALRVEGARGRAVVEYRPDVFSPWERLCAVPCSELAPYGLVRVNDGRDASKAVVLDDASDGLTLRVERRDAWGYVVGALGLTGVGVGLTVGLGGFAADLGCWWRCAGPDPIPFLVGGAITVVIGAAMAIGGFVFERNENAKGKIRLVGALPLRVEF